MKVVPNIGITQFAMLNKPALREMDVNMVLT